MENIFIPYGRQTINDEDIKSVESVLKSDFLTQGPQIKNFEEAIATFVHSQFALAVNSATSALHLGCMALDLQKGDYLWTSPNTFVASANCAKYCGAKVDFVDIDISTGLISINELSKKLCIAKEKNCLPKIIIPVHLGGASCEMKEIYNLSKIYKFKIIEDASHAIGGLYEDKPVGCCEYSDISIFSFHPVKIITTGEGGIATTNDLSLFKKMNLLRSHGITKDNNEFIYANKSKWYYEQQNLGYNYRITDIAAALGINQLKRINEFIKLRERNSNYYRKVLKHKNLEFIEIPNNVKSAHHLTIIKLKNFSKEDHMNVFDKLREKNIGVQVHYIPVHLQPYYRKFGYKEGDFPASEKYSVSCISLPNYPSLTLEQIDYIANSIKNLIKNF